MGCGWSCGGMGCSWLSDMGGWSGKLILSGVIFGSGNSNAVIATLASLFFTIAHFARGYGWKK